MDWHKLNVECARKNRELYYDIVVNGYNNGLTFKEVNDLCNNNLVAKSMYKYLSEHGVTYKQFKEWKEGQA